MSSLNSQRKAMKKATVDAKKAAANDRENGNGKAAPKAVKQTNPAADEKYNKETTGQHGMAFDVFQAPLVMQPLGNHH
jgi:23S rRNA G2069 N7-methylase RlmK/C1962 C5-methylase RlmI